MSQNNNNNMSTSEKKKEDWMNTKWRPMMGWVYMAVCLADFVLFPVLWSLVQAAHGGSVQTQWNPITLQGAGLFHMAMGAIIGVAAFGRTQEKLAGANNGGIAPPPAPIPVSAPTPMPMGAPTPIAVAPTPVATGFGGRAAPPAAPQPEL